MARPKKSIAEKHSCPQTTRFTAAEAVQLQTIANGYGITVSDYIRRRALNQRMPAAQSDQQLIAKLTSALIRLGVNLNQIARVANIKEKVLVNMLYELIVRINEKLDELDESR